MGPQLGDKTLTGRPDWGHTVTIIARLTTLTHLQWKTVLTKGKNVQYYSPQSDMKSNRFDLSMIVGHKSPQMGAFEDNNWYP